MGKILIVDDDRSVVFMLAEVLRDAGHDVVATLTAEGVPALLEGVDAAVVDLHLPGESGVTIMSRIHEYDHALPVVLLTGDSRHPRANGSAHEIFEVMTKPPDIDEVLAVLERALSKRRIDVRGITTRPGENHD